MEPHAQTSVLTSMSEPAIVIHTAVLILAGLALLLSLAGIAYWWIGRKIRKIT
ncbi:MAG TPA: hypothetical protein VFP60_09695 [Pseudolabrys sp.]|nr:hypothetical protein [Pseudolabrys sp.]